MGSCEDYILKKYKEVEELATLLHTEGFRIDGNRVVDRHSNEMYSYDFVEHLKSAFPDTYYNSRPSISHQYYSGTLTFFLGRVASEHYGTGGSLTVNNLVNLRDDINKALEYNGYKEPPNDIEPPPEPDKIIKS